MKKLLFKVAQSSFWGGIAFMCVEYMEQAIRHIGYEIGGLGVMGTIMFLVGFFGMIILSLLTRDQQ